MSGDQNVGGFLRKLFGAGTSVPGAAVVGPDMVVTPDATRCVQCGVCGYNCPVGIPVRDFARQGKVVNDARCVQCGQCIAVCPRGTLRWAPDPRPHRQTLEELDAQLFAEGIVLGQTIRLQAGKGR